jgi:hypothetical protein
MREVGFEPTHLSIAEYLRRTHLKSAACGIISYVQIQDLPGAYLKL